MAAAFARGACAMQPIPRSPPTQMINPTKVGFFYFHPNAAWI